MSFQFTMLDEETEIATNDDPGFLYTQLLKKRPLVLYVTDDQEQLTYEFYESRQAALPELRYRQKHFPELHPRIAEFHMLDSRLAAMRWRDVQGRFR